VEIGRITETVESRVLSVSAIGVTDALQRRPSAARCGTSWSLSISASLAPVMVLASPNVDVAGTARESSSALVLASKDRERLIVTQLVVRARK